MSLAAAWQVPAGGAQGRSGPSALCAVVDVSYWIHEAMATFPRLVVLDAPMLYTGVPKIVMSRCVKLRAVGIERTYSSATAEASRPSTPRPGRPLGLLQRRWVRQVVARVDVRHVASDHG